MKRRTVTVTADSPAAPGAVYRLLADGPSWPSWSPIDSFAQERPGDAGPNGIGEIRVYRRGRTTGRDQVIGLVAERRFEYASLSGLPVRDYVGVVDLDPAPGGGTTIHWQSSFFPTRPGTGWLLERGIRRFLAQCAHGLADYAASSATQRNVR